MTPTVLSAPNPPGRRLYFDNNAVEDLLARYHWTGCTDVRLRNEIMAHAGQLIEKVIKTHGLHRIGSIRERTLDELASVAWVQIESTLYKYRARPHCTSCYLVFNPAKSALVQACQQIPTPKEVAEQGMSCPVCSKQPHSIIYRGTAKVFSM